jgi:hypothetical protein
MHFKKKRLGTYLLKSAADSDFFSQVHIIFGGSGAVGGATAMQMISLFEEGRARRSIQAEAAPHVVITARTKQEIRNFTSLLFRLQQRDHGCLPEALEGIGYQTAGGVIVELHVLSINPELPDLFGFSVAGDEERRAIAHRFLSHAELTTESPPEAKVKRLVAAIREQMGRPFTEFLLRYWSGALGQVQHRVKSVVVSIPLATVATYKLNDLEAFCQYLGLETGGPYVRGIKIEYLKALVNDLEYVARECADNVLIAHTTAVGGMYDEDADGARTIRLGFAHSAVDERLAQKQAFADELARLYAGRGVKVLVTAAAIGVDSIIERKTPPLSAAIRRQLRGVAARGHAVLPEADVRAGVVRVYPPVSLDLLGDGHDPLAFCGGHPLALDYVLKSGENGFFTVSNADALYRVMRVASNTELGLLLARTALFGDDPRSPSFTDNVCYYTESDYSRQVFDLLAQPALRRNQLSGLQPKALQDLGSAKHQGELHLLGLLILFHRLRTLRLEMIPRRLDLNAFDPHEYFESHSEALTLEEVAQWDAASLAKALKTLVRATKESDLEPLKHFYQTDPAVQEAIHRVMRTVISAARAVPSLGTPVLYEEKGRRRVYAGYYAAPLDTVVSHRDALGVYLRGQFARGGGGSTEAFERFVEYHIASFGFADIRPVAVLVTAKSPKEGLDGKVTVFTDERSFVEALRRVEPYEYFCTSGLLALLVRLRGLCRWARQLDPKVGSENGFRAQFLRDEEGRTPLVPGVVEAFRMVSEGLEKNTGLERLDGPWGYGVV